MDPIYPDGPGEYALQLTDALVALAVHTEITVLEPGYRGDPPAADVLLLPAGGRPAPGYRCLTAIHQLAEIRSGLTGFRGRFRAAFAASRSDVVIAPSEAVAEALAGHLRVPAGRIVVVSPGVGPAHGRSPREEVEAARSDFVLPERYLLGFGDAALAREAWRGATTPAGAGLVMVGELRPGRDRLRALLSGALGVLLCEPLNGCPMRALEAMSCGSPPVVPDDGAFPEIVRDGGLTVRAGDVGNWSEAISALYRSRPLRMQLSARGRELAAGLTAAKAARRVLGLLQPGTGAGEEQRVDPGNHDRRD